MFGLREQGESLCKCLDRMLSQLMQGRTSHEVRWRDIEDHFGPGTARALATDTPQDQRGNNRHNKIINGTPLYSADTLMAGMMSGNMSPARPWFRLTPPEPSLAENQSVKVWIAEAEKRMRDVFAKSNIYRVMPTLFRDAGTYATSVGLLLEDEEDIVRLKQLELGSYWISQNSRGVVDSVFCVYQMTVRQMAQEFGLERCSEAVRNLHANGQFEQYRRVKHAIGPNTAKIMEGGKPPAFVSVYWEDGGKDPLAIRRFESSPILAMRWNTSGEAVYGTACPGFNALGDAKALQFQERRKAQVIDKLVDPPLQAPTSMRKSPIRMNPGDVNYFDQNQAGAGGLRPVYEMPPQISGLLEDIDKRESLIRQAFYVDLFLMLSQDDRSGTTAYEIQRRNEEKMLMLGPVVERVNDEVLSQIIDRTFDIMVRRSAPIWAGIVNGEPLLPPPPEELAGVDLRVEFISILAQAQKGVGIAAQDNLIAFVGQLSAAKQDPSVWDKIDSDQAIDERAEMLGSSPGIVRSDEDVEAMRTASQQQQQMMQMAQAVNSGLSMAKTASETEVGDSNALTQAMRLAGSAV